MTLNAKIGGFIYFVVISGCDTFLYHLQGGATELSLCDPDKEFGMDFLARLQNFSILDPGIENSISGLQSLAVTKLRYLFIIRCALYPVSMTTSFLCCCCLCFVFNRFFAQLSVFCHTFTFKRAQQCIFFIY